MRIQNRCCRLQHGFRIGAVGYSVVLKLPLLAIPRDHTIVFICILSKVINDLLFDKLAAVGHREDSKLPLYATARIQNCRCTLQRGFKTLAQGYSGNPLKILITSRIRKSKYF